MTNTEDPTVAAYRAARSALDDAPAPATRAAILAAAARAVHAQPHAADAPAKPLRRFRAPLAAAASVLVGCLAVLLTQLEERAPTELAMQAPAASAGDAVARRAPPAEAAAPAADRAGPSDGAAARAESAVASDAAAARTDSAVPSDAAAARADSAVPSDAAAAPPRNAASTQAVPPAATPRAPAPMERVAPLAREAPGRIAAQDEQRRDDASRAKSAGAAQAFPAENPSSAPPVAAAPVQQRPARPAPAAPAEPSSSVPTIAPAPAAPPVAAPESLSALRSAKRAEAARPSAGATTGSSAAPFVSDSALAEGAPPAQTAAPAPNQDREPAAAKPIPRVTGSTDNLRTRLASTAAPEVQADPQRWLARIVELRAAGDDATANAELERLRARYPDVTIPAAALPRTGTR